MVILEFRLGSCSGCFGPLSLRTLTRRFTLSMTPRLSCRPCAGSCACCHAGGRQARWRQERYTPPSSSTAGHDFVNDVPSPFYLLVFAFDSGAPFPPSHHRAGPGPQIELSTWVRSNTSPGGGCVSGLFSRRGRSASNHQESMKPKGCVFCNCCLPGHCLGRDWTPSSGVHSRGPFGPSQVPLERTRGRRYCHPNRDGILAYYGASGYRADPGEVVDFPSTPFPERPNLLEESF